MAIKAAVRWKPDTYRSSLETTVSGFDGTTVTGSIVQITQLVAYDDSVVTGGNYKPGDPSTALSDFGVRVALAAPTLVKAIRSARRSNPVVLS